MKKRKHQAAKSHPQNISCPWTPAIIRKRLRRKDRFISLRAIQRIENARRPVTEQQLAEFARVFGVSDGQRARPSRD